jgi:hypothetical protein
MNKRDFLNTVPSSLNHPSWGFGEIKIIKDSAEMKVVSYVHENNQTSFGTIGSTWGDVFEKLKESFEKAGFIFE